MADFMENEAVESDSDGSEDLARKKRPVGGLFVFGVSLILKISTFPNALQLESIKEKRMEILTHMPGGQF